MATTLNNVLQIKNFNELKKLNKSETDKGFMVVRCAGKEWLALSATALRPLWVRRHGPTVAFHRRGVTTKQRGPPERYRRCTGYPQQRRIFPALRTRWRAQAV